MKHKTGFMQIAGLKDFNFGGYFKWHDCHGCFCYVLAECMDKDGNTEVFPGKVYLEYREVILPDMLSCYTTFKVKSWKPINWCYQVDV